jgi:hypothetical protein
VALGSGCLEALQVPLAIEVKKHLGDGNEEKIKRSDNGGGLP